MNQLVIRNVLEKPAKSFKSDAERKAKVYYESCLDVDEHMEKLGAKPMNDLLREIGGWNVTQSGYNVTKWKLGNTLKILHNKLEFATDRQRIKEYLELIYKYLHFQIQFQLPLWLGHWGR